MPENDPIRLAIRNVTLFAAFVAYAALSWYVLSKTTDAKAGQVADITTVEAAALGALAVALGGGFAAILGVPAAGGNGGAGAAAAEDRWDQLRAIVGRLLLWLADAKTERWLLVLGVIVYFVACSAMAVVWVLHERETPDIVKTIATGFGGYVLAYVSAAYQRRF